MRTRATLCITGIVLAALFLPARGATQTLPDSLITKIRAGAAELVLGGDSVVVPLVGSPTLPLVEVVLNGTGKARFLLDLGANVVIVRRDVFDAGDGEILADRSTTDIGRFQSSVIGSAEFREVVVGVYDSLDVDGVIGYNLLQYSSFTMDYPRQRFSLHRRELPEPDGRTILRYQVTDRMPYVRVSVGGDSLLVNFDTGAAEWITIPPRLVGRISWATEPVPGPRVSNNQTGEVQVLQGHADGFLRLGVLEIWEPLVYVNSDADDAWLGSSAMQSAAWTFDTENQRVGIELTDSP